MSHRTVVITGATSGIGKAAASALVLGGAHVIILSRTEMRAVESEESIVRVVDAKLAGLEERRALREAARARSRARSERQARFDVPTGFAAAYAPRPEDPGTPVDDSRRNDGVSAKEGSEADEFWQEEPGPGSIGHVVCDLGSPQSIRAAAQRVLAECDRIDVLINNAAVLPARRDSASPGRDLAFEVNHLGHFLLTNLLLPGLEASKRGRIIVVTCGSALREAGGNRAAADLGPDSAAMPRTAYRASKLANVLHARTLHEGLQGRGVDVAVVAPGRTATKLGSTRRDDISVGRKIIHAVLWPLFLTPVRAAEAIVRLADPASSPDAAGHAFRGSRDAGPLGQMSSGDAASALWELSRRLTGRRPV